LATYCTKIRPLFEYAAPVWGGLPHYLVNHLERIQRRSLRIIGLPVDTLPPLSERKDKLTLREMEAITQDVNHPCHHLVPIAQKHDYSTRSKERGSNVGRIIPEPKDINHRLCLVQLNFLIINFKLLL
jgi:hypothetical protein